jgi:hypothetical protein
MRSSDGRSFVPYDGEYLPHAAVAGRLLSIRSPLSPGALPVLHESTDGGESWSEVAVEAIVEQADCTADLCLTANDTLLVFHPDP